MIFLKEIQNEIEAKASLLGDRPPCCALCERGFYWWKQQPTVLHIGVYAGSSWDVPTSQRSHALDRAIQNLKNPIPTFV